MCDEHAKIFTPANPYFVEGGSFHWGDDADQAYAFCDEFFRPGDVWLPCVEKMLEEMGQRVGSDTWVVDGTAYLFKNIAGMKYAVRMGPYVEAKELFPKLFELVAVPA